jgi:predicted permease
MSLWTDLALSIRSWRRTPAQAAVIVAILSLGVGATATVFAVVEATLLRPMPFAEPERLMFITTRDTRVPSTGSPVVNSNRLPQFIDWQRLASFSAIGAWAGETPDVFTVTGAGVPERVDGLRVTAGLLPMLGARPHRGRLFRAGDDAPRAPQTVILSDGYWRRRFGGRDEALGATMTIENVAHTVVGVLPADFPFSGSLMAGRAVDLYLPLALAPEDIGAFMAVVGRLAPGVSVDRARAELALQNRLTSVGPRGWMTNLVSDVLSIAPFATAGIRNTVLLLFGAIACVWLLACANLANLLLVRATGRRRELQVRAALGANLWQIFRQTLVESAVIVAVSGAAAMALAVLLTELFQSASWLEVPRLAEARVGWAGGGFAVALCAATALLFGALPLLHVRHRDGLDALRPQATAGPDRRAVYAQRAALAIQVAFALVLTTAGGLLGRSIVALLAVDPGFHTQGVMAMRVDIAGRLRLPQRYPFFVQLLDAVRAVPGVQSAALTINLPLDRNMGWDAVVPGRPFDPVTDTAFGRIVSPGYFETTGIRIVGGRDFDSRDSRPSQAVVAINETLAKQLTAQGRDPLATSLVVNGTERRVVAVVADVKHESLDKASGREVYVPQAQAPAFFSAFDLVVRADRPTALVPAIRDAIWRVDASQAIGTPIELQTLVDRSLRPQRLLTATLTGFATVALLLAALGVYGVVGYRVSERTRELAIRVALGGQGWRVTTTVLRETALTVGVGLVAGLPLAFAAGTALRAYLFNVHSHDASVVSSAFMAVVSAALMAAVLPARRATRVDPAHVLRAE